MQIKVNYWKNNIMRRVMLNFKHGWTWFRLNPILFAILIVTTQIGSRAAETAPKLLFPDIIPVCSCENLKELSLPNTTIESAVIDTTNRMCLVTAIVTHPPAEDCVKVWVGLPLTNWNGRFQGNGGAGFLGGNPANLRWPVARGFAALGRRGPSP